jgi:hypothetical protein
MKASATAGISAYADGTVTADTPTPVGPKVRTTVLRVAQLPAATVEAMYRLHARHFDNDNPARFHADLAAKQYAVVVETSGGGVVGFSTIQELQLQCGGTRVNFMFSGDTIVDPSVWTANALAPAISLFIARFIERHDGAPCYWFLICKGYRTYRCLPLFFRRFIPSCRGPGSPDETRLLELVAHHKFGARYSAGTGVVSYDQPLDHLNHSLCSMADRRASDPHVGFFLAHNPGWTRGEELACLARLSDDNLLPSARRVIEAGRRSVRWRI